MIHAKAKKEATGVMAQRTATGLEAADVQACRAHREEVAVFREEINERLQKLEKLMTELAAAESTVVDNTRWNAEHYRTECMWLRAALSGERERREDIERRLSLYLRRADV